MKTRITAAIKDNKGENKKKINKVTKMSWVKFDTMQDNGQNIFYKTFLTKLNYK
jgi:hypothetical protein